MIVLPMAGSSGGSSGPPTAGTPARSRRVVGLAMGDRLHRDLALAALRKAPVMRRPPEGLVRDTDVATGVIR